VPYPDEIETFPVYVTGTPNPAGIVTAIADTLERVQIELGPNPSGGSATVADRLNTTLGSNVLLYIRYTGSTVPLRNTVTTDLTRTVVWICPSTSQPTQDPGYAVAGVDLVFAIVS
jgi:hypothetical protein